MVFGLPGTGRYLVQGAIDRDYPLVMGMVIVYGVLTLLLNLLVDLACGWLDPGVRYGWRGRPRRRGLWRASGRRLQGSRLRSPRWGSHSVALARRGPVLSPHGATTGSTGSAWRAAPGDSRAHWFGTDRLGRDLLVRALHGCGCRS